MSSDNADTCAKLEEEMQRLRQELSDAQEAYDENERRQDETGRELLKLPPGSPEFNELRAMRMEIMGENSILWAALDEAKRKVSETYQRQYDAECLPDLISEAPEQSPEEGEEEQGDGKSGKGDREESPEVAALRAAVAEMPRGVEAVMLKDPERWTEGEMRAVMASDTYWRAGDPERAAVQNAVTRWHDRHYGTGPMRRDAPGRGISSGPVRTPADKPAPLTDGRGQALGQALARAADGVARQAKQVGVGQAVNALQAGMSLLSGAELPLKRDGVMGPKTKTRLRQTVTKGGAGRVAEASALGRIRNTVAGRRQGGSGRSLDKAVTRTVGPLYEKPDEVESRIGKPTNWKRAFQDTVNDSLAEAGQGSQLKTDGILGPKTSSAFTQAVQAEGPDRFANRFGDNLGLI